MSTVVNNILYVKTSPFLAQVGDGSTKYTNGIYDKNSINPSIIIEGYVTIDGKKLVVNTLSQYSFSETYDIYEVIIPNTIEVIGSHSFWGCHNLKNITFIPGSRLKSFGVKTFDNVRIKELIIPGTVTKISSNFIYNVHVRMNIKYCGDTVFSNTIFGGIYYIDNIYVHSGYKSNTFGNLNTTVDNTMLCPSVVYQNKYTHHSSIKCDRTSGMIKFVAILLIKS